MSSKATKINVKKKRQAFTIDTFFFIIFGLKKIETTTNNKTDKQHLKHYVN